MLKRYQVLLPEWLEDYIKFGANVFNISFSELIRIEICFAILSQISELFPNYQIGISFEEMFITYRKYFHGKAAKEEISQLIDKLYFETRKAVEFRFNSEMKEQWLLDLPSSDQF